MKHLGDITKIDWSVVEPVDVVTGGSPCQDLSVAGKRAGLAGERSGLYMEQIRCVKELRQADVLRGRTGQFIRPRFMVWENVPGAFSSGTPKGSDFAAVIEELIKIAEPDASVCIVPPRNGRTKSGCYYADDGRWSVAWRVHDAQFWGVPQRRKRIALVADFGGLAAPEVLFERKGLSGDFEPCETQRQETARSVGEGAGSAITGVDLYNQTTTGSVAKSINSAATDADHIPCVMSNQSVLAAGFNYLQGAKVKGIAVVKHQVVRRLTPLECERLQGYPDHWTDIGEWVDSKGKKHKEADSPRYKALGNSIALPFWCILAKRISAQYDRDITMGSLFDGIGGFPYAFEKCNGKGAARWASEIEEFPMAVTKLRFGED